MKAKALLILGLVAGGVSAADPVVSANIVGYVNVTVKGQVNGVSKYSMISNPLKATSNKVSDVIKLGATDDLQLFHFTPGGFVSSAASGGDWLDGADVVITPGGGFFAAGAGAADVKITFVGEVDIAGAVAGHNVPTGLSIQSSVLPKAGRLADLEYPLGAGDNDSDSIFQFLNGSYVETDGSAGAWLDDSGKGPNVAVAESFWVKRAGTAALWKQPSASALLQ
jgi:hypothetical protein